MEYASDDKQANEKKYLEVMNTFMKFRGQIRVNFKQLLDICDEVREKDLIELGIRV